MGPLTGLKVIEIEGIGPAPMCAMLLADLGAEIVRIARKTPSGLGRPRPLRFNLPMRNRRAIALDLKDPHAIEFLLSLVKSADVLIEGFRPGVMERLGLGPDVCHAANERLVYGRMTGWGQSGPLKDVAAHDINYISITGALNQIGRRGQPPTQPLNLVGDFGGGALYLAFGIMSAVYETQQSGKGQVVDAAIVDGVASLLTSLYGLHAGGLVSERGTNPTDTGSHFYNTYKCADGKWISVGAIETKFYNELLRLLEIDPKSLAGQWDSAGWDNSHALLTELFQRSTRDEWCAVLEGTDVCFAPVLTLEEAPNHPHLRARGTFVEIDGIVQPAPAPRFSRTPAGTPTPPEAADQSGVRKTLADWMSESKIAGWEKFGIFNA